MLKLLRSILWQDTRDKSSHSGAAAAGDGVKAAAKLGEGDTGGVKAPGGSPSSTCVCSFKTRVRTGFQVLGFVNQYQPARSPVRSFYQHVSEAERLNRGCCCPYTSAFWPLLNLQLEVIRAFELQ